MFHRGSVDLALYLSGMGTEHDQVGLMPGAPVTGCGQTVTVEIDATRPDGPRQPADW